MSTGMNALKGWALALLLLPGAVLAAAPPELTGMWEGKLAIDPKTSLTVQFTFTKAANGAYAAVLNSPDNLEIKNTATNNVTWDGSNLKLQVPSLSGSYAGTLKNGKITGQWTQPGSALALELAPFQKPVISASTAQALSGSWAGALALGGNTRNIVFQFKQAASGGFEGAFVLPDQGANLPMASVTFENGDLSFKVPQAQLDYKGKLAGGQITGKVTSPSGQMPPEGVALNMKRGEYKPPVAALKLSAESFAALKGKWQGTLEMTNAQTGAKASIPLIVRFEADKGQYVGYLDSPSQNAKNVPITEATFADGKLLAKIALVRGEFSGTLSGSTLTGEWSQGGAKTPLTLTR